jgi:hypothetical protein
MAFMLSALIVTLIPLVINANTGLKPSLKLQRALVELLTALQKLLSAQLMLTAHRPIVANVPFKLTGTMLSALTVARIPSRLNVSIGQMHSSSLHKIAAP